MNSINPRINQTSIFGRGIRQEPQAADHRIIRSVNRIFQRVMNESENDFNQLNNLINKESLNGMDDDNKLALLREFEIIAGNPNTPEDVKIFAAENILKILFDNEDFVKRHAGLSIEWLYYNLELFLLNRNQCVILIKILSYFKPEDNYSSNQFLRNYVNLLAKLTEINLDRDMKKPIFYFLYKVFSFQNITKNIAEECSSLILRNLGNQHDMDNRELDFLTEFIKNLLRYRGLSNQTLKNISNILLTLSENNFLSERFCLYFKRFLNDIYNNENVDDEIIFNVFSVISRMTDRNDLPINYRRSLIVLLEVYIQRYYETSDENIRKFIQVIRQFIDYESLRINDCRMLASSLSVIIQRRENIGYEIRNQLAFAVIKFLERNDISLNVQRDLFRSLLLIMRYENRNELLPNEIRQDIIDFMLRFSFYNGLETEDYSNLIEGFSNIIRWENDNRELLTVLRDFSRRLFDFRSGIERRRAVIEEFYRQIIQRFLREGLSDEIEILIRDAVNAFGFVRRNLNADENEHTFTLSNVPKDDLPVNYRELISNAVKEFDENQSASEFDHLINMNKFLYDELFSNLSILQMPEEDINEDVWSRQRIRLINLNAGVGANQSLLSAFFCNLSHTADAGRSLQNVYKRFYAILNYIENLEDRDLKNSVINILADGGNGCPDRAAGVLEQAEVMICLQGSSIETKEGRRKYASLLMNLLKRYLIKNITMNWPVSEGKIADLSESAESVLYNSLLMDEPLGLHQSTERMLYSRVAYRLSFEDLLREFFNHLNAEKLLNQLLYNRDLRGQFDRIINRYIEEGTIESYSDEISACCRDFNALEDNEEISYEEYDHEINVLYARRKEMIDREFYRFCLNILRESDFLTEKIKNDE